MPALDAGCRRGRGARECWRCCKIILPAREPCRPSPRLARQRPWVSSGDFGIDDGEDCEGFKEPLEARRDPETAETNVVMQSQRALPFAVLPGGFHSSDDGSSISAVSSSAPCELEDAECQAISELRGLLQSEAGVEGLPEDLLHCCCRVSRNDIARAYQRARDMLEWRAREGVDCILADPAALAEEESWRQLLRYGLAGRDRKLRPVMIQAVGRWDMKALNEAMRERKDELLRSHVVLYEMLRRQAQEGLLAAASVEQHCNDRESAQDCAKRRPRPARWVLVLDVEGLSIWHTRYPEVLACLKEVSAMGSKYYPEHVDRMFVVNASSGFHLIWRLISRFLKPNTRAKVRVLPEGDCRELVAECGAACIPVQLGGHLPAHLLPYVMG